MRLIYQIIYAGLVLFTLACSTYLIVNTSTEPFIEEENYE